MLFDERLIAHARLDDLFLFMSGHFTHFHCFQRNKQTIHNVEIALLCDFGMTCPSTFRLHMFCPNSD